MAHFCLKALFPCQLEGECSDCVVSSPFILIVGCVSRTGTLYIHWHALESCRLIVSLSTDDDWSGRKGIISERKLRAILAASTSLPHPLVKTAAADDVTWSRMIRSRAFSTDVAAAIAPLFRYPSHIFIRIIVSMIDWLFRCFQDSDPRGGKDVSVSVGCGSRQ